MENYIKKRLDRKGNLRREEIGHLQRGGIYRIWIHKKKKQYLEEITLKKDYSKKEEDIQKKKIYIKRGSYGKRKKYI